MVVAFDTAVGADGAHSLIQRIVVGEESSAVAITAERLGGKETGA